jgi:hypothetical protein
MPALAHAIGLGRTEWIDRGCVVAFLLFAGVGTFALVLEFGWAGLAFAFLPSTLIAMDRMTINVSLAALTAVALVARRRRAWTWFWPAVALAPVAHPQGWVLPVAAFLVCMRWKDWRGMVLATASLVPGLVLLTSVQRFLGQNRLVIDAIMDWLAPWSLLASIEALWTKVATAWTHEWRGPLLALMHWLDNAALLAIGLVAIWTVWRFKARTGRWERWALFLLVVPGSLVDAEHHLAEPFMWLNHATPLVLLHWADTPRDWRIVRWAPLAICSLRTLYQFGFQVLGVLRGLTGG